MGADAVIYQDLADLEAAVAALSPRPGRQSFEVGVFTGKYCTPVDEGYLEHLEQVRGARKKLKVAETARKAVVNGSSDADVKNLAKKTTAEQGRKRPHGAIGQQDISLHNMNDYGET